VLLLLQQPHLVLLVRARQEARHIHKRDDGDVEGVAEADEPAQPTITKYRGSLRKPQQLPSNKGSLCI
jgi:hypothetical protein